MRRLFLLGFWLLVGGLGILVFGILGGIILSTFTSLGGRHDTAASTANIRHLVVSDLQPDGELAEAFSFFSSHTDVRRDELKRSMTGKLVSWYLPVFNVTDEGDGEFVIQTDGTDVVGTFCHVKVQTEGDRKRLLNIKSGDYVQCRGVIKGISFRNIVLDPAELL